MRNKMFWRYARDDFMFTTVRVISKHQDTQVYGAILPQQLTNQAMLESKAYMTYRAYATGEKTPKPKSTKKKADSKSSLKTKPTQSSKGKRIKTSAKGDKPVKMNKKELYISYASGSGHGVDILSKVPDKQQQTVFGTNEGAGDKPKNVNRETKSDDDKDDFVHLNLSTYNADDQEEEDEEKKANDDDEVYSNQMVTPPNYEILDKEDNQEDDDKVMRGEQEDEELYGDLNLNLDRGDAAMTEAQINQETKEVHVTLTTELSVVQQQSSSVSSDLVSKFINPTSDTGIDSILNLNVQSDIPVNILVSITTETPSFDTTIPQPPIPIIQPQQQTHDSTTTTIPSTSFPEIPNCASLFGFERRLQSNKLREEAQAENDEFLKQIESNIKAIIKDQTSYTVAASLSEFELKKILIDKIKENKSMHRSDVQKNLYNALIESYNSDKDIFALYGTSRSQPQSSGKSAQVEEHGPRVDDLEEPFHQEFNIGNDHVSLVREIENKVPRNIWSPAQVVYNKHAYWGTYHWGPKHQKFYGYATKMETSNDVYSRHRIIIVTSDFKRLHRQDIEDMLLLLVQGKLTNLNLDERFALNVALRINRLMLTDELHKFSDGTLNHVRIALNDIAAGFQMEYLPKRKWSKQDKQRARVIINAIDKKLRDRRLMRSLEKFVGGRPYKGDL
nr:hypothetical protein [Tanacetum cinerariifolium]